MAPLIKQTRQDQVVEYAVKLKNIWFDEMKKNNKKRSLHGIIGEFIDGLYDTEIKHKMTVWRQKNPRARFTEAILVARKEQLVTDDDIPDFDEVESDGVSEDPAPEVKYEHDADAEDIQNIGENLNRILQPPASDRYPRLYPKIITRYKFIRN